jgi:hypothetical protein
MDKNEDCEHENPEVAKDTAGEVNISSVMAILAKYKGKPFEHQLGESAETPASEPYDAAKHREEQIKALELQIEELRNFGAPARGGDGNGMGPSRTQKPAGYGSPARGGDGNGMGASAQQKPSGYGGMKRLNSPIKSVRTESAGRALRDILPLQAGNNPALSEKKKRTEDEDIDDKVAKK